MIEQDYFSEPQKEGSVGLGEYRIEVARISEPGPTVEVHNLFHRLYSEPQERGTTSNPYVAKYRRLRAKVLPRFRGSQDDNCVAGSVEYRYWPSLKLGYIENAYVSAEIRRKGLGVKLINFAVNYMRRKGSHRIYAFAVNSEGCGLLASAGFAHEPPEDPESPWRRWFFYNIDQTN